MKVTELLKEQESRGLSKGLTLDEQGVCRMDFGTCWVTLESSLDPGVFYAYGIVNQLSGSVDEAVLREALYGNLFGRETGRAVLAYEPSEKLLILFQRFQEDSLAFDDYWEQLQEFILYLEHWKRKLDVQVETKTEEAFSLDRHLRGLVGRGDLNLYMA